jgi:hypothetical protein
MIAHAPAMFNLAVAAGSSPAGRDAVAVRFGVVPDCASLACKPRRAGATAAA